MTLLRYDDIDSLLAWTLEVDDFVDLETLKVTGASSIRSRPAGLSRSGGARACLPTAAPLR